MKCLICGDENFEVLLKINHKCKNCGHIFTDGPKDLDKYYNDIYRKGSPLPTVKQRTLFTNNILEKVKKIVNLKDKKIVEAGSADGLMSQIISDRFEIDKSNFLCVELDKNLATKCSERGFKTWNCSILNVLNIEYNVLFAIDILEHIKEIDQVKKWLLKEFKYVILQLPRARGPKTAFKAHFQTFSDKSLEIFLEGFKILSRWDTNEMETCFGKGYLVVIENESN